MCCRKGKKEGKKQLNAFLLNAKSPWLKANSRTLNGSLSFTRKVVSLGKNKANKSFAFFRSLRLSKNTMEEKQLFKLNRRGIHILLHAGIWLVALGLHTMVFLGQLPWKVLWVRSVLNIGLMAVVFYTNLFLMQSLFARYRYLTYFFWLTLLFATTALLRAHFNIWLTSLPENMTQMDPQSALTITAFITNIAILAVSIFYGLLRYYQRKEALKHKLEQERKEAELQFLKAQINPHFLFNTLNNIYSLAIARSKKTADMVLRLSELLRYVIYEGQKERVPLAKELKHIEEFIALFKMRMEKEPRLEFNCSGNPSAWEIEPLMLMPLVENCFKHCDFDINEEAYTHISVRIEDDQLWFAAKNSMDRRHEQKDQIGGVGLHNMRKRLALLYPNAHHFDIKQDETSFEVRLQLPLTARYTQTESVWDIRNSPTSER